MSRNLKNRWKLIKIANIDVEILHNFWTTSGISMNFLRKMSLLIILKDTKNQGFTLSFEGTFFEKLRGGQIDRPPAVLRLNSKVKQNLVKLICSVWQKIVHSMQGTLFVDVVFWSFPLNKKKFSSIHGSGQLILYSLVYKK